MKRYIFGIIAIIMAVAFSSFTTQSLHHKALSTVFFEFDYANYAPTQANVQSDIAWIESTASSCPTTNNQKPCKIEVDASATHLDGGVRKLNTGINIQASRYLMTSNYYVSGGSDVQTALNQHL